MFYATDINTGNTISPTVVSASTKICKLKCLILNQVFAFFFFTMMAFGSLTRNASRFVTNLLVRYMMAGVLVYVCAIGLIRYRWFSWHVILCTFGIFPLMVEALLLFTPDELWSKQLNRTQKYWIHGGLMLLGTILVTLGCIETFCTLQEGYHLYTVHGITGLISMILLLLSVFLGLAANYSQKLLKYARPVTFKFNHNLFGLLGYVIGCVSLCYAYYTNWFIYYTSAETRTVVLIATILVTLWSLNAALVSGYEQIKSLLGK